MREVLTAPRLPTKAARSVLGIEPKPAVFRNQQGEIVIEAHLTGIIPGSPEKEAMDVMMAEGDPTNKCR